MKRRYSHQNSDHKQNFTRMLLETIHLTNWFLGPQNHAELKILFIFGKYFHNNSFFETAGKIRHTQNFSLGRGGRVTLRQHIILCSILKTVTKTVSHT